MSLWGCTKKKEQETKKGISGKRHKEVIEGFWERLLK